MIRGWRAALRASGRAPYQGQPLVVYQGGGRPRRLFYFIDDTWCRNWSHDGLFPRSWRALARFAVPTNDFLETIRKHVADIRLPLHLVGSLHPHTLAVLAVLRSGSESLERNPRAAIPVRYLGIDDRWLELCETHLRKGEELHHLESSAGDRRLWEVLREVLPDARELVGSRCFELLEQGKSFPFIAATNPSFYRRSFHETLLAHLGRAKGR